MNLNPKGRKQTYKFRPVVPITSTLLPFMQSRELRRFINWHGKPIRRIGKGFKTVVRAAGLSEEITPCSLRHTMAVELRKPAVPPWEVEGLLGHRRPGPTEVCAQFSLDYLSLGREAIDAYFAELGLELPAPAYPRVSPACQANNEGSPLNAENSILSRGGMVGGTGIEPVTPTMSKFRPYRNSLQFWEKSTS
ncbi:tyrosine-type recombinase/integrase [Oricola indica]|uniref:tyrosine-type recombinase/integrase n=1 Tax=Oricola indica TaxID=2872591 RepID=UPI003CCC2889